MPLGTGDLEAIAEQFGAWVAGTVAASPAPTTTTATINELDIASGTSLKGALLIIKSSPKAHVTNVSSNNGAAITFPALSSAPSAGDRILVFPQIQFNATVSAPADISQVSGASVTYSSLLSPNTGLKSSNVSVGTSATALWSSSLANRRTVLVYNDGSDTVYVGDSSVTTSNGVPVAVGSSVSLNLGPGLTLYGISGTAGQDVRTLEVA